jgi:putative heme-binding domain-containing protein
MIETTAAADSVVKAEAIWWLLNRKDSAWKEFGVNEALKQNGIYDPEAVELMTATVPAPDAPKFAVADVKLLTGDATQGAAKAAACFSCHRIGNQGTEYAPNLTGWAQRQPSEVLIQSIINPSADIAHGYSGMELKLKDGTEIQGLVLSEGDPVIVASAGGLTQMVPAGRIASKKGLGRSLMLSADQQGLSAQDVADVAAWLKTQ